MRVEPELTTHLKFRRLKAAVGDIAMECLVTIWAHCQQNQRGEFWPGADVAYVEGVCSWTGNKGELFRALVECGKPKLGFIVEEPDGVRIHDWEDSNSQTVQNWFRNGRGRGAKAQNQRRTGGQPTANPTVHGGISEAAVNSPDLGVGQNPETPPLADTFAGSNDAPPGSHGQPTGSPVRSHGQPSAPSCPVIPINPPSLSQLYAEARRLVQTLNTLTGSKFNLPLPELDQIVNRLHEVQYDFAGVEKMLRHRTACWLHDPKSRPWLKPGTLFGPNFHDYFGQRALATPGEYGPHKKTSAGPDRTELLETLSTARAQLKQNPDDAGLAETVRQLEAAAG